MFKAIVLVFIIACAVQAAVVHLDDSNFDSIVDGSKDVLVEFFAPWCGHCKTLAPEYKSLGETFSDADGVIIADVDATIAGAIAKKFGVSGYPTLKWFPKGSTTPKDYDGGRTAELLTSWVNRETGLSKIVKAPYSAVTVLTAENFDSVVDGSRGVLVEFYAPWCGHCKTLTPKYEELALAFEADKDTVVIAKVDADSEKDLGSRFGVSGFPTLKYFPAGAPTEPIACNVRETQELVSYVNLNAGTFRNKDGSLSASAGRIAELDSLISGNAIDADLLLKIKDLVAKLEGKAAKDAAMYLSLAEKILEKGKVYVETESKRLMGFISSKSISPTKKALFALKKNILSVFA
jgi:protein disulfide-isomerase A6